MNIGICLRDTVPGIFWDRLSFAHRQGFTCVGFTPSKVLPHFEIEDAPQRLSAHLAEQVRWALAIQDMYCAVLNCGLTLPSESMDLEDSVEIYRAHLRFARMIGAETVGVEIAPCAGTDGAAFERLLSVLALLTQCAEAEDSILALAMSPEGLVDTPERAMKVLAAAGSSRLRLLPDAGWLSALTGDISENALLDRVCGLTLAPHDGPDVAPAPALRLALSHELPILLKEVEPQRAEAVRLALERQARGAMAWAM